MPSAGSATLKIRERPFRGGQRTRDSESTERSQSLYYDDLGTDERHFGPFGRCFQLPEGIDADKIEALISFGVNILELFRRAAEYVDKILRGATPADMPVESPAKFDHLPSAGPSGLAN
ncbi:MAG: Hsp20 family protein, partial [Xanthobacteraceae bacterium]